jgi:hypothetical protein
MGNDPYAGLGTPVADEAPPAQSGADPYAGLGQSVLAHDITGKNGRVYRVLLNSEDQRGQVEQAINARIDAGDADLTGKLDLPFPAEVHHPAPPPPPPPPPDTSFGHNVAVAGKAVIQGGADFLNSLDTVMNPGAHLAHTIMGGPDMTPGGEITTAAEHIPFGDPQTSGQEYLHAGVRSVTGAAPFGVAGGARVLATTALSGAGSGLSSEFARQQGFGRGVQTAAGVVGGLVPGGAALRVLARNAPEAALPEASTAAPPPIPRGPMATIARLTGSDRSVGARLVAQRLHDDGINPYDAGRVISEAQANGTPAVLADLGENTRALASSVSRQAGPARTIAKGFTKERQMGQMDRVRDAINRDIGPTTDVLAEAENLGNAARAKAQPLYQAFEAHDPVQSPRLDALLATPSGRKALARAREIAADDMAGDAVSGLDSVARGTPGATFSPRVLDYVKKGLDDVVESFRDKTTGRLTLDEGGRATNTVRANFIKEADRLIPEYGAARAAYAGPAAMKSALLDGKAALNKSASEINQRIKNMTPAEADQYGLGLRSAIAEAMERSPDGANKVRSLIGDPRRRAVLQRVFGGKANLDRFVATMENEQAAFETHQAVNTGSPTAPRLAEDQANSDLNLVRGAGSDLASVGGGHIGIGLRALERGTDLLRFGAGRAGNRAREDAASLLFSASPGEFRDALGKITLQSRRDLYRRQGLYPVTGATVAPLTVYGIQVGSGGNPAVDRYGNKP